MNDMPSGKHFHLRTGAPLLRPKSVVPVARYRKPMARTIYDVPIGPIKTHDFMNIGTPGLGIGFEAILRQVCGKHQVGRSAILSLRRQQELIQARFELYYRLRNETRLSFPCIGRLVHRHHSTVLHGALRFEEISAAKGTL
jgi:hypothetical protein